MHQTILFGSGRDYLGRVLLDKPDKMDSRFRSQDSKRKHRQMINYPMYIGKEYIIVALTAEACTVEVA